MWRRLGVVLCAIVVVLGVTAGSAAAFTPSPGAVFNNPRGTSAAKYRILSNIIRSINSTPSGATIRFAAYSFDRKDVADALIRACDRHVAVQMVLNDNWTSDQTLRLQRRMGTDLRPHLDDGCNKVPVVQAPKPVCTTADPVPAAEGAVDGTVTTEKTEADGTVVTTTTVTKMNEDGTGTVTVTTCRQGPTPPQPPAYAVPSFVRICVSACRGYAGNQHMKFYLFSKAGTTSHVTMVGSANLTRFGAVMQWNDMYTVAGGSQGKGMFDLYSKMFAQLAEDSHANNYYYVKSIGDLESRFSPHPNTTISNDPMMQRLNKVRCRATGGTGIGGRTAIRILMYGWQGDRGLYLANKVANLRRSGCNVRVILSSPGRQIIGALKRGGVLVKSADLDLNGRADDGFAGTGYELFTHEKWMTLSGGYGTTSSRNVWTGSENWSNLALMNDEVNLRIPRAGAYNSYVNNFNYIWGHWSRWL